MSTETNENVTVSNRGSDYHKKYYLKHKDDWNNKTLHKINYCRRVYGVKMTGNDIAQLGDECYKDVARYVRDTKTMLVHADFLARHGIRFDPKIFGEDVDV